MGEKEGARRKTKTKTEEPVEVVLSHHRTLSGMPSMCSRSNRSIPQNTESDFFKTTNLKNSTSSGFVRSKSDMSAMSVKHFNRPLSSSFGRTTRRPPMRSAINSMCTNVGRRGFKYMMAMCSQKPSRWITNLPALRSYPTFLFLGCVSLVSSDESAALARRRLCPTPLHTHVPPPWDQQYVGRYPGGMAGKSGHPSSVLILCSAIQCLSRADAFNGKLIVPFIFLFKAVMRACDSVATDICGLTDKDTSLRGIARTPTHCDKNRCNDENAGCNEVTRVRRSSSIFLCAAVALIANYRPIFWIA